MADLTITATDVVPSAGARIKTVTAGATVTRGMPVYKDTGDNNEYKPTDANGVAPANTIDGIALADADDGQSLPICQKDDALAIGSTVGIGDVYVASATPGGIAPVADAASGWFVTIVGVAVSTTELKVNFVDKLDAGAAKA